MGVFVFQKSFFLLKKKQNQRQHRRNRAQKEVGKTEFSVLYRQKIFVLYSQKICLVQTEHSAQKKVPKSQISLELIFCIVKTENRFLPKNWNFDGNFQSKSQFLVKTSKLEDQYTKLFNLALWPEEPPEIHFFEKCWSKKSSKNHQKIFFPKMSGNLFPGHLD